MTVTLECSDCGTQIESFSRYTDTILHLDCEQPDGGYAKFYVVDTESDS